jgi:ParB family chromosome partitioning protein
MSCHEEEEMPPKPAWASPPRDAELGSKPPEVRALAEQVEKDGGRVTGGVPRAAGQPNVLSPALPIDKVSRPPTSVELSPTHAERLATVMTKVGRFLDPLIAIAHDGGYWTPTACTG